MIKFHISCIPRGRPTNDISIEFEVRPKFAVLWFKTYSTDHNEFLRTSRQYNCRDGRKMSLWSVKHILNRGIPNFDQIYTSPKYMTFSWVYDKIW